MKPNQVRAGIVLAALCVPMGLGSTVACTSTTQVHASAAPIDLSRYRTFSFDSTAPAASDRASSARSAEARRQVEQTATSVLEGRGYTPANGHRPDMVLRIQVGEPPSRGATEFQPPSQLQTENSDWYDTHEQDMKGPLLIDAFDARTGQLIWHGSGESPFDFQHVDRARMQREVEGMLSSFPVTRAR